MAGRIVRLDQCVVDKIAAGEVVHRPASALKELLENSLDAGAKQISVVAGQGGMKLLQITDDGCGIRREDLDIVCERFTTSKLRKINLVLTGTALHDSIILTDRTVALIIVTAYSYQRLQVGLKTLFRVQARQARRFWYVERHALQVPTPHLIYQVEDMFYNLSTRKQALKNVSEQYHRVLDVMQRYAIQYGGKGTSFVCKKHRENTCDLNIGHNCTQLDVIKSVFGSSVATDLVAFSLVSDETFKTSGYVSNANFKCDFQLRRPCYCPTDAMIRSTKKNVFIVFINNRLVDCPALRRACEYTYAQYLPKHTYPFVFLSLEIPPHHVDVNVHPTKREVHFLHEEAVVEAISSHLNALLQGGNQSRTFTVQPVTAIMASHLSAREKSAAIASTSSSEDDEDRRDIDEDTPKKKHKAFDASTPKLVQISLSKAKTKSYAPSKVC
ncbi:hypothetical protein DYB32_003483 [Aphanomyces invadans]|uniref:DNA mismatch repair protein S5 domain-containing protein n=1 Tax=Aphanomyces invadans TaxID=157072 RepID=A0A3R6VD61_9STRA|nr:hypothetical protein DYB32_003483 [Aphanomyces invadans]